MRSLTFTFMILLVTIALAACGASAATTPPAASAAGSSPPAAASSPSAGGSSPSAAAESPSSAGGPCTVATAGATAAATVTIKNFAFSPDSVTANVGDVIVWTNEDSTAHTATVNSACTTAPLSGGASGGLVFSAAGTYPYVCNIHPTQMKGTIVIR
jgi:plastocyanin